MTLPPLILASKSAARYRMLKAVGLEFDQIDPAVDEDEVKRSLNQHGARAVQVAETLAELKGRKISRLKPNHMVIASDQVLVCNGIMFDKPVDLDQAHAHLTALQGQTHSLETAVCLTLNGERIWHFNGSVHVDIRPLKDKQIQHYIEKFGRNILNTVGCYQVEEQGALIFSRVTGDPYTIQGMPLIELIRQLENLRYILI